MSDDLDLASTATEAATETAPEPPAPVPPAAPAPDVFDPDALAEARAYFRLAARSLARAQDPHVAWDLLAEALVAAERALAPDPATAADVTTGDALDPALAARPADTTAEHRRRASDDEARAQVEALTAYLRPRLFWGQRPGLDLDRRWLLRGAAAAVVLALVAGTIAALQARRSRRRDLAAGKTWESSTNWGSMPRTGTFTLAMSQPFFHTEDEQDPWLDIDLGATQTIQRVEIDNRADYGKERAVPLIIEVAVARNTWRQVARRDEVFDTWVAPMPPNTQARWVRVQAKRRTLLHLDDVRIY